MTSAVHEPSTDPALCGAAGAASDEMLRDGTHVPARPIRVGDIDLERRFAEGFSLPASRKPRLKP